MTPEPQRNERCETDRRAREAVLAALVGLGGEARRQPLLAKAIAEGGFSESELAAPAPATTRARYANEVSYRVSRALHELKREGRVEQPAWNVWSLCGEAAVRAEFVSLEPIPAARIRELGAMAYHEYLRTPEWQRLREAALTRAGLRCALDPSHTEHLEVHHNTFERFGAERRSDLIVLCHSCHQAHHHVTAGPRKLDAPADAEAHRSAASIAPPSSASPTGPGVAPRRPRSRLGRLLGRD